MEPTTDCFIEKHKRKRGRKVTRWEDDINEFVGNAEETSAQNTALKKNITTKLETGSEIQGMENETLTAANTMTDKCIANDSSEDETVHQREHHDQLRPQTLPHTTDDHANTQTTELQHEVFLPEAVPIDCRRWLRLSSRSRRLCSSSQAIFTGALFAAFFNHTPSAATTRLGEDEKHEGSTRRFEHRRMFLSFLTYVCEPV